jgi:2-polyprenyl-3-methyl-5-hydroxy-6-metoxy-1,4-benzoquinol methylase
LQNVKSSECDVGNLPEGKPFDAAVGCFILEFVNDPVAVLQNVSEAVRPGGVIALQEVSWAHFLLASLPAYRSGLQAPLLPVRF